MPGALLLATIAPTANASKTRELTDPNAIVELAASSTTILADA